MLDYDSPLNTNDIGNILSAHGLDYLSATVEYNPEQGFSGRPEVNQVYKKMSEFINYDREFVVYRIHGWHYNMVYYQDKNNIFLIDSLKEEIRRIDPASMASWMEESLQEARRTRARNYLGIIGK
jgi:hypothetical protein